MGRDKPLTVKVVDHELQITIGIDTLKWAAEHSPDNRLCWPDEDRWDHKAFIIENEKLFAQEVVSAIDSEVCCGGDGTTYLHQFLDDAMVRAIEEGSIAISEEPEFVSFPFANKRSESDRHQ